MQAAIQLLKTEIKNTEEYKNWIEERLKTGDLQDSTEDKYYQQSEDSRLNILEYKQALRIVTKANSRGRFYVQAIGYLIRSRNYFVKLLGPRLPIDIDSIQLATGERSNQDGSNRG